MPSSRDHRNTRNDLRRLFIVAFAADFLLYVIYTAIPFKALRLGAGPFELGAIAAVSTGTYAVLVAVFGRLSDRWPRTLLARSSCLVLIAGCMAMTLAPSVGWMLLGVTLIGGSMAPFWPSVQASIADRSSLADLQHHLGRFNLAWSSGKGSGFLVGGFVVASMGVGDAFTLACVVAFGIFFVLPWPPPPGEALPTAAPEQRLESRQGGESSTAGRGLDARAPLFRRLAWVANGVAFGVGATLNHHYPRLIREFDWSPRFFGVFLGVIYLTQTLSFVVLMLRPEWWRFRRLRLYAPQLLLLLAILALPRAGVALVMLSALVFGAGLGICYYSSIYYSLHTHESRGRNAGVHEGLIGLGSMTIPFLGGLCARSFDNLAAPYLVAGSAIAIALLVQEWLYRRGGGSG